MEDETWIEVCDCKGRAVCAITANGLVGINPRCSERQVIEKRLKDRGECRGLWGERLAYFSVGHGGDRIRRVTLPREDDAVYRRLVNIFRSAIWWDFVESNRVGPQPGPEEEPDE